MSRWTLVRPVATLAVLATAANTASAQFGTNLVVNGGAEAAAAGQAPPGWTVVGSGQVVSYATGGGFPTASDPGSPTRGRNFFAGGATSVATFFQQRLNLSDFAGLPAQIDAGSVTFTLSAYLGGFASQDDNAQFAAYFLNSGGDVLQEFAAGPVSAADRGGATGMLFRSFTGLVPQGSVTVVFALEMLRLEGSYNDGYADDLSFVLTSSPTQPPVPGVVPEPASVVLMGTGLALLGVITRRRTRRA